jgi:thymidine phosphorylase
MVAAQGGDLDAPRVVAPDSPVTTKRSGYIASMDAEKLGQAVIAMRGGRKQLGDELDLSTGFEMLARLGDRVEVGQPLATLFAPSSLAEEGRKMLLAAIEISDEPPTVGPLILERIK